MPEARKRKPHGGASKGETADEIPLAQATRDTKSNEKTLIQEAEERTKGKPKAPGAPKERPFVQPLVNPDGTFYAVKYQDATDEEMSEFSECVLYGISLGMIYFTMDVMVYSQFAEKKLWGPIFSQSFVALGMLLIFTILMHPRAGAWWAQAIFLVGSIVAGCFLVSITSLQSSFAVMKQAPPVGTLWIWFVVEQRPEVAFVGFAAVAAFYFYGDNSIF